MNLHSTSGSADRRGNARLFPGLSRATAPAFAILALALSACGRKPAAAVAPGPVEVGVVTLAPSAVTLTRDLPGRISAFRVAEVRARVNGIVVKRLFTEGSDVKEGQPLFRIDPAPYRAAYDSARAQLSRAEARVASARVQAERYTELVAANAVSKQEHDDTITALKTAEADVAAARAAVQAAQINLGYTTVTSPVSGRIGRSAVTEGAYVQAAQATLLATVQQLDPVFVDVTQSSSEVLQLRRDFASGRLERAAGREEAKVTLLHDDGKEYDVPGSLQFADVTVDPGTGSITLRALFPNPRDELLPGMFVRARLAQGVSPQALLVPQRAVTRNTKGEPTALVVNGGKVELRVLVTDRAVNDAWLVTSGVKPGEQVIVEGLQKVRPGAQVTTIEAGAKQAGVPAADGDKQSAASTAAAAR
jgi:membrane fusion protein (multidrug efflux system)